MAKARANHPVKPRRAASAVGNGAAPSMVSAAEQCGKDFSRLLESLPFVLIGIDAADKVCLWSNGCKQSLHYPPGRVLGLPLETAMKRLARRYRAPGLEALGSLAPRANGASSGWQFEFFADKEPRLLQADFSPLPASTDTGEKGGGILLLQDVTERQRLENSAREAGRLAALGRLAAAIAHEVRNPLTAVKAAAQLLTEETSGNGAVSHYAAIISREADRLDRLVGDFLLYAKPPALRRAPVEVEELLRRCCELLENEAAGRGITLEYCSRLRPEIRGGEPPLLSADGDALLQALLNLAKNSLEAVEPGGKVSLSCRRQPARPGIRRGELAKPDPAADNLAILIRDNGRGILRKHRESLFTPFFTTKPQGTGLGLPIAKRIIENHGGSLVLTSAPGRGTRVTILLPLWLGRL